MFLNIVYKYVNKRTNKIVQILILTKYCITNCKNSDGFSTATFKYNKNNSNFLKIELKFSWSTLILWIYFKKYSSSFFKWNYLGHKVILQVLICKHVYYELVFFLKCFINIIN